VSGGFATVQPGNLLSINAVEAYSLEDFSPEAVRSNLAEAQKVASGSGSEEEVAEAKIEVEVYEALQVIPQVEIPLVTVAGICVLNRDRPRSIAGGFTFCGFLQCDLVMLFDCFEIRLMSRLLEQNDMLSSFVRNSR
jgi:hypothetical protein